MGTLILLSAGLESAASSRHPTGGSIGAVIGPCVEGNRRTWGGFANRIDDDFNNSLFARYPAAMLV